MLTLTCWNGGGQASPPTPPNPEEALKRWPPPPTETGSQRGPRTGAPICNQHTLGRAASIAQTAENKMLKTHHAPPLLPRPLQRKHQHTGEGGQRRKVIFTPTNITLFSCTQNKPSETVFSLPLFDKRFSCGPGPPNTAPSGRTDELQVISFLHKALMLRRDALQHRSDLIVDCDI